MESLNNDKEIKKATLNAEIFSELTDIFFLSSVAMAIACVAAGILKAAHLEKNHLPLGALMVTNLTGSVSMLFLMSMTRILKNEALDERNRLLKDKNTVAHHNDKNVPEVKSKER